MTKSNIDTEIKNLKKKLNEALQQRDHQRKLKYVVCTGNCHGKGCGKRSQVRTLTYIQTHWYTPPSGCMGGDYWNMGEGEFVCPKCRHLNREYEHPSKFHTLKDCFKEVVKVFDKDYNHKLEELGAKDGFEHIW